MLEDREPLKLIKYKAVLEASPPTSLEDAMALTERLDAYNLNWAAASPEDVARGELRRSMGEENACLLYTSSKNFFCSSFFNAFAKASLVLGANRLTSHRDSIEAY